MTWNLSITASINEIQSTASGQGTFQLFHLQIIWAKCKLWAKCKPPSQKIQGILCFPKPPGKHPPKKNLQIRGYSLLLR